MERIINLHIERLPEGVYLATSDDVPGLVAQGRTVPETLEIARDIAKKLLEAQQDFANGQLKVVADATSEFGLPRRGSSPWGPER
jgi:predicted RNase H-like HicB family nuclease